MTKNPFAEAAHAGLDPQRPTPPRALADLSPPIRPVDAFPPEVRCLLHYLIDSGDLPYALRDGARIVSYHDLNPYLPPGSDPLDWDPELLRE